MLITGVFGYPTDDDIKSIGVKRPRVARKDARGIETVKIKEKTNKTKKEAKQSTLVHEKYTRARAMSRSTENKLAPVSNYFKFK